MFPSLLPSKYTRKYCPFHVWIIVDVLRKAHAFTSVGRILLLIALHVTLKLVSNSQHCPLVFGRSTYCMYSSRMGPWQVFMLWRSVWVCSKWWVLATVLLKFLWPDEVSLAGCLHQCSLGWRSALGDIGCSLQWDWQGGPVQFGWFGSGVTALGLAPGLLFMEWWIGGRKTLPSSSHHAIASCITSLSSCGVWVWLPAAWNRSRAYFQFPGTFSVTPLIAICAYCCGSHLPIVWAQSICPPHPDPYSNIGFFLSCTALRDSFGCGIVIQSDNLNLWLFIQGQPLHAFSCPAIFMRFLDYCASRCIRTGVLG